MVKIFKLHEIDLSRIHLSDNDDVIVPEYENSTLYFETPKLQCIDKYDMNELLVSLSDTKANIFFDNLDRQIINEYKKIQNNKIIYKSIIRQIGDINILRIKFNKKAIVFDKKGNIVKHDEYNKIFNENTYIKLLFELSSIWTKENVFGVHLKLHQIKVMSYNHNGEIIESEEIPLYVKKINDSVSSEMEIEYVLSDSE